MNIAAITRDVGSGTAGCGQKRADEKRFPLSGKVSFKGEPIDLGSISFITLETSHRVSGGTIMEGAYAVPEAHGAHAGKHRVEVRWQKKTGKKIIRPFGEVDVRAEGLPESHTDSKLTSEVGDGRINFDFDLTSDNCPARNVDDGVPQNVSKPLTGIDYQRFGANPRHLALPARGRMTGCVFPKRSSGVLGDECCAQKP